MMSAARLGAMTPLQAVPVLVHMSVVARIPDLPLFGPLRPVTPLQAVPVLLHMSVVTIKCSWHATPSIGIWQNGLSYSLRWRQ